MAHKTKHEFSFEAPHAKAVAVAGSFNDWNPAACPMSRENGGPWKARIHLNPGKHPYRFVVDGRWMSDPAAKESVANEFGETNSIIIVVPEAPPPPPQHQTGSARKFSQPWDEKPNKPHSDASLLHAAKTKIFGVVTPRTEFPSPRITDRKGRGIAR